MKIKKRKIDNTVERRIIIGMIISSEYLNSIIPIFKSKYLTTPYTKRVARWCVRYFEKYEKAPSLHIQDIFNSHKDDIPEDHVDYLERFLDSINEEYVRSDKFNNTYLLDKTVEYFKERSLTLLADDVKASALKGEHTEAEASLALYNVVQRPLSNAINPFTDEDVISRALLPPEEKALFKIPGALGKYLGSPERDNFWALMGPEKRGKTFMMFEFSLWAIRSRCNVAVFQAGDLSEEQAVVRLHIRNTGRPLKNVSEVKIPVVDCVHNQTDDCDFDERACDFGIMKKKKEEEGVYYSRAKFEDVPDYVPCTACKKKKPREFKGTVWHAIKKVERLDVGHAIKKGKKFAKLVANNYRLITYPNDTLNVATIEQELDILEKVEGFVADIIIIDYADILAPEPGTSGYSERNIINKTWKTLRALSMKRKAFVLTATQTDTDSYDRHIIREKNFSEDKRKFSHVHKIITLNQSSDEKEDGVIRLGQLFVREDSYDVRKLVVVLQCLDLKQGYVDSYL